MRLLITGGTGCLGAAIAERQLAAGSKVLVIDNFATSSRESLAPHPNLTVLEGSIADHRLVDSAFEHVKPSHVVHSAASYKDPNNWQEDIATNVAGTAIVVDAAVRAGVERFVYFNTALCYGRARQIPITPDHPLAPFTSYSISKTAGENYVALAAPNWISLRLANVYGPRHFSGPIPTFYKRLKAGQPCTVVATRRDFVEMEDFLQLMDRVFERPGVTGAFNVSSGHDYTIKEVYLQIAGILGIELAEQPQEIKPDGDDVASLSLDSTTTRTAFDWKARTPLSAGLSRQIEWFERHGVGQTYTHLAVGRK